MIVQMSDGVEARRNISNSQLRRQGPFSLITTTPPAPPSNAPKHWATARPEPVRVEALLGRVGVELGRQLVEGTLSIKTDSF